MAIVFSPNLPTDEILNSSNNNIVVFRGDTLPSRKAIIYIDTYGLLDNDPVLELTPINDRYYFDFKNVISTILAAYDRNDYYYEYNTDFYSDDIGLFNAEVRFEVVYENDTYDTVDFEYKFIRGVEQIGQKTIKKDTDIHLLSADEITVFKGFPFDFSIYTNGDIDYNNITNGFSKTMATDYDLVSRVGIFSDLTIFKNRILQDGATYEENICYDGDYYDMLQDGTNEIQIDSDTNSVNFIANLSDRCSGTYLKWINDKGGYSYWLFNPIHKESTSTKTKDKYFTESLELEYTTDVEMITGKTASNVRSFSEKNLSIADVNLIKSILTSPRVDMLNGVKDDVSIDEYSWQAVTVQDGSFEIANTKRNLHNLNLSIKINQYTQL